MKLTLKSLFCLGLLAMAGNIMADCDDDDCSTTGTTDCNGASGCAKGSYACARPDFLPFSQGENRVRDYAGQCHQQNLIDLDDWNFVCGVAYEYQKNFDRDRLGRYFSPSCTDNSFVVGEEADGSIHMRGADIGLSPTFRGTLTMNPQIQNHIFEGSFYFGLDRWLEGLFLWTKVPFTHTTWQMELCETSTQSGHYRFATNYMDQDAVSTDNGDGSRTLPSIMAAFSGLYTFGDKDIPLQAGRILACEKNKTGVADVPVHLGYNFLRKDRGYLGAYVRAVFPTGTIEVNRSIFDPRIGYNRWQLGGGLQGRLRLYENDERTTLLHAYMDFHVTHVFDGTECRLFDMATGTNRPTDNKWSRYILMKQFDSNLAYTGRLRNFADVFTACVDSGFDWLIDGLFFLEYEYKNWSFDLGYEIKARDCEDFECVSNACNLCDYDDCDECCSVSSIYRYGVKGGQSVNDTNVDPVSSIRFFGDPQTAAVAATTANTLSPNDISTVVDTNSGMRPRTVAHKFFADFGYTWDVGEFKLYDNHGPIFMNCGASIEFGDKNKALRQWGVWGKWGVAYN